MPLLLDYYKELPERQEEDNPSVWVQRCRVSLRKFKRAVEGRYCEATLERLLGFPAPEVRQAAVLALGLSGTMAVNKPLAARLHDHDPTVRALAGDALWSVWFRAALPVH